MGILGINETIKAHVCKKYIEDAKKHGYDINEYIFHTACPLENFRGKKVAFDAPNIMYAKMSTAHNNIISNSISVIDDYDRNNLIRDTMKGILGFFALVFKAGITPVVVFDGKYHPYKEQEAKRRGDVKKAKQAKVDLATQVYISKNPLEITQAEEELFRKELKGNIKILKTDYYTMQTMLEDLGIFCIVAEYDGEQLCSRLCKEGLVTAVYSTDTDNYAHGCNLLINNIRSGGNGITVCDYVSLHEMIIGISHYTTRQITQEELIDLCILHGCDYNERTVMPVKNFNINDPSYKACGGKGALDFFVQYPRFEYAPQYYWPVFGILNIHRCREIFFYEETSIKTNNVNTDFDWDKFIANRERVFQTYDFDGYLFRYFMSPHKESFLIKSR